MKLPVAFLQLTAFILFGCLNLGAQNLWVVSNDPSFSADFDTIQNAIDAASPGDKIYVHGSTTAYSQFTVDKKLHLIGSGRWKTENMIPDENPNWTRVSGVCTIAAGGDNTIVEGFYFDLGTDIEGDSVIYRYNRAPHVAFVNTPMFVFIYGNFLLSNNEGACQGSATSSHIRHNIVSNLVCCTSLWDNNAANIDCSFEHNSIYSSQNYSVVLANCSFNNNIVVNGEGGAVFTNTGIPQNNIFTTTSVTGLDSTNLTGVEVDSLWNLSDPSPDGKFRLIGDAMSNPALGFANDGSDVGAYGGASPYILSGIVPIPIVYDMIIPLVGDTTNMLNVTIKAKSND